ncbi:3-hydroxybutyrate dehydrogenase [Tersicoccus sp. Bi-70]|uniref:3-hydroxybutyrate dehydrogenase n=1 Tax=Tersicoccus sp. Bi-70 TaxID=1897634 RepID=UPI0009FA4716|nr:3-hydroxybutyrate dehydrogenase [Tersicoccus sp. Bi-70]
MSTSPHTSTTPAPAAAADLTGRTALVTGAASGIGAAIARALAGQGAHVVAADRDDAGAQAIAEATGGTPWTVDLSDLDAVAAPPVDEIDILVNNAGIQRVSPIEEFDPADFRRIITLMLESPFMLIRAALPHMYAQGWGRIVNISSVHGLRASAYKSAYVTAKHGLEGLSKTTALEGGPHGVTSNCINPAYVNTPLVQHQIADQAKLHGLAEDEVVEKIMLTESSIKRLVEPDEVASLALWLVSAHAGMVTGASYTMDGGWSAR